METDNSTDATYAWNTLLDITPDKSSEMAHSIFSALIKLAGELAPLAGTINLGGLQGLIYQQCPRLRPHSNFFDDLEFDLQKVSSVFVPPFEYEKAKATLKKNKFLTLTGPAHIGKTATAFQLALDLRSEQGDLNIIRVRSHDNLMLLVQQTNCIYVIDDCFGQIKYSATAHGDELPRILGLSKSNYIIITTRTEVYAQAQQDTRLNEYPEVASSLVELRQEHSYNHVLLTLVLRKHLEYMQSDAVSEQIRLNNEQVAHALQYEYEIVQQLRFPHNIDVLCRVNLKRVGDDLTIMEAIKESSKIKEVVQKWANSLPQQHRWFVFLVALLPGVACRVLQTIYREVADKDRFQVEDIVHLVKVHYSFLSNSQRPQFSHPSYEQAVIELMRKDFAASIAEVVDLALRQVMLLDTLALGRCDNADYVWPRAEEGQPIIIKGYLDQFIEAYNHLLHYFFSSISDRLPPYRNRKAAVLLLPYPDGSGVALSIVDVQDESSLIYLEHPNNIGERIQQLMQQAWEAKLPIGFWSLQADDLRQRSPHLHAFSILKDRVQYVFQKQRLSEAWPLLHARAESALRKLSFSPSFSPIRMTVDWQVLFTSTMVKPLWQQFGEIINSRPDGWPEAGWNNMMQSTARQLNGLEKSVRFLEEIGRTYDGPLLIQPDLPIPNAGPNMMSFYVWERYSDIQMHIAIKRFFELAFLSYREMVESNFSSLKTRFSLYQHGPFKVLGALTYKAQFGSSLSQFYFLPVDFPLLNSGNFEIYVKCDLTSNNPYPIPFDSAVVQRLNDAEAVSLLPAMSMRPSSFISNKELIQLVYNWLQEDLDEAMAWQNVGHFRSHINHQYATSIELPPNTSLMLDMFRFQDPWEIFDWPEL